MKKHLIIHGFALAHMLVVLLFHFLGVPVDIFVTMLTMLMVFTLSHIYCRTAIEASLLSLAYILLGYFLGTQGAVIVNRLTPDSFPSVLSNMLVTFALTELYGWVTYLIVRQDESCSLYMKRSNWMVAITLFCVVLVYRIFFIDCMLWVADRVPQVDFYDEMVRYCTNLLLMLPTELCIVLLTLWISERHGEDQFTLSFFFHALIFSTVLALPAAFLTHWHDLLCGHLNPWAFALTFLAVAYINLFVNVITKFAYVYYRMYTNLQAADNQRHKAQYQYQQLKQQLNPHFLFNCLNILDYIVQAGEKERASAFIRKLANIYRYQLSMSEVRLVPISEELRQTGLYVDLLQERFGDAFQVDVRVPEEYAELEVVPCSVQLMVENAQKHNQVSRNHPLRVEIYVEGSSLCVRNNLQPRLSQAESNGVGLQNIRLQYADICKQPVEVINNGKCFLVKLPII